MYRGLCYRGVMSHVFFCREGVLLRGVMSVIHTYSLNFIWIGISCVRYGTKNRQKNYNFDQIFTLWGLLCIFPFTDLGQIWHQIVYPWSMLA